MASAGKALPALPAAPSPRDPITTEMLKKPALQELNLDKINQRWYNDDKIESVFQSNKCSSPKRRRPNKPPLTIITEKKSPARPLFLLPQKDPTIELDLVEKCGRKSPVRPLFFLPTKDPTIGLDLVKKCETKSPARPLFLLPPKDPTIGRDLVEKCDKAKVEFKIPQLLPQKIDFDKINEYYRNEENKLKQKAENKSVQKIFLRPSLKPQVVSKGCRKALFKPSRTSVRKSLCKRTSALSRKSVFEQTMIKNLKVINDSLLDSSLVERKIFNAKSRGTFKVKSPCAVQKKISRPQLKSPAKFQGKKTTPKNVNKKPVSTLAKKPSASQSCTTNSTANYLEEIENLLLLDKTEFDNFKKELDNLNRKFDALNKARDDRFDKIKSLLQKIEPTPSKCKKDAVDTEPTAARNEERKEKKFVKFDANVNKALDMYNSMRQNYYGALSTPKINNFRLVVESPTPKDPMKNISRKVQQQCLMLQDTPIKK